MTDIKNQYIETTNLYWEMLWKAQKIEDRKLVAMLHLRLQDLAGKNLSSPAMARIIAFPVPQAQAPSPRTVPVFWPSQPATNVLAYVATYCILMVAGVLANLS